MDGILAGYRKKDDDSMRRPPGKGEDLIAGADRIVELRRERPPDQRTIGHLK
jgi:hypothetical protein